MKSYLLFISLLISVNLSAQKNQQYSKLKKFILQSYKSTKPTSKIISHRIDTIIQLKNGNYFALVANNISNASASESGTFDCLEVSFSSYDNKYYISNSLYGQGDNTGGMGDLNLSYRLFYLNENDYIIVTNKNITHHGNYNLMNIFLNSKIKLLEISLTEDSYGVTESSTLSDLIEFKEENGILSDMTFKSQRTISSAEPDNKIKITEKTYQIRNSDFDLELGCITQIKLLGQVVNIHN